MTAILFAFAAGQVAACEAAVHQNLPSAVAICAPREVVLFNGDDETSRCDAALKAGVAAGKFGPGLPDVARNGLVRDFDQKLVSCRAPQGPPTKTLKQTQLWD